MISGSGLVGWWTGGYAAGSACSGIIAEFKIVRGGLGQWVKPASIVLACYAYQLAELVGDEVGN